MTRHVASENSAELDAGPFNVGEAASRSGVSAEMVRHCESLGLLPKVGRTDSGYRRYTDKEVHTLRFIRRGRDLGFSMAEISELLELYQDRRRASANAQMRPHNGLLHAESVSSVGPSRGPCRSSGSYHSHMRRFVILLMVFLLPVRGWAGDVMGVQMAMMETVVSASSAMPPGCPMEVRMDAPASARADMQVPAEMEECASCQLCIPLAVLEELQPEVFGQGVHAQPLMYGVTFQSVPLASALKPPIY